MASGPTEAQKATESALGALQRSARERVRDLKELATIAREVAEIQRSRDDASLPGLYGGHQRKPGFPSIRHGKTPVPPPPGSPSSDGNSPSPGAKWSFQLLQRRLSKLLQGARSKRKEDANVVCVNWTRRQRHPSGPSP